ncbi:cytoplasmic dynein 2 light intermediate chain [Nesidiocoris tenuis]|uniref:Cytoplasmic dynein 2 light intermediate chain 1 n=1 Tax=Nesidiocoris tenuis TaxID=355587 RepID=A0ABN7AQC6_9HEMI|nr:cytoplasmic dynein 2 light intermediate chain [Nesidiocoris tenuis]
MADPKQPKAPELMLPNENTYLDWAVEEMKKAEDESTFIQPSDRTLLVVGSRNVGKTTFIVKTFDLEEEIKPTLGMEYYFALNSDLDAKNELCNIWELGGGTVFSGTLYAIENMPNLSAILVLDLSNPHALSHAFRNLMDILGSYVTKRDGYDDLKREAERSIKNHRDADVITPFPVPLVMVCTKFDKFQSFEPEQRRVICKYLRFLAHRHHATLYFFSSKAPTLVRTSKEVMRHYTHGFDPIKKVQFDYNKPLLVPAGSDSFASIDEGLDGNGSSESYEKLLGKHFKQEPPKEKKFDITPILAGAKERRIDDLLHMKEEELAVQKVEEDLKGHLSRAQHLGNGEGDVMFDMNF